MTQFERMTHAFDEIHQAHLRPEQVGQIGMEVYKWLSRQYTPQEAVAMVRRVHGKSERLIAACYMAYKEATNEQDRQRAR